MNWEGYEVEGQMDISEFLDDKGENMNESAEKLYTNYSTMLSDLEQYRALGTVEELKAYKQGSCANDCKHYDSSIEYVRNKAIDEFVATLVPRLTDAIYQKDVESMTNLINGVARELKAGAENE